MTKAQRNACANGLKVRAPNVPLLIFTLARVSNCRLAETHTAKVCNNTAQPERRSSALETADFRALGYVHAARQRRVSRGRKVYVVVTKSLGVGQWKFPLCPLRRSILSLRAVTCATRGPPGLQAVSIARVAKSSGNNTRGSACTRAKPVDDGSTDDRTFGRSAALT